MSTEEGMIDGKRHIFNTKSKTTSQDLQKNKGNNLIMKDL